MKAKESCLIFCYFSLKMVKLGYFPMNFWKSGQFWKLEALKSVVETLSLAWKLARLSNIKSTVILVGGAIQNDSVNRPDYTHCCKITYFVQKLLQHFWAWKPNRKLYIRVTYFLQTRVGWLLQIYFLDKNWSFGIVCKKGKERRKWLLWIPSYTKAF